METQDNQKSQQQKDAESQAVLDDLRKRLNSGDSSNARRAAFHLSWLQEDGFEVLNETLLDKTTRRVTKNAAAYGLRSMRGRMKKIAMQVLLDGLENPDKNVRVICEHSFDVIKQKKYQKMNKHLHKHKRSSARSGGRKKIEIRDVRAPRRNGRRPSHLSHRDRSVRNTRPR